MYKQAKLDYKITYVHKLQVLFYLYVTSIKWPLDEFTAMSWYSLEIYPKNHKGRKLGLGTKFKPYNFLEITLSLISI